MEDCKKCENYYKDLGYKPEECANCYMCEDGHKSEFTLKQG